MRGGSTSSAWRSPEEISWGNVSATTIAVLGNSGALSKRSDRRSMAYHGRTSFVAMAGVATESVVQGDDGFSEVSLRDADN